MRSDVVCDSEMVEPTDGRVLSTAAGLPWPFFLVKLMPSPIEVLKLPSSLLRTESRPEKPSSDPKPAFPSEKRTPLDDT